MTGRAFSVCVYCGSRADASSLYTEAAREVGHLIGERRWRLVYGGGRAGLMGTVADAVLEAGGTVVGVIPRTLVDKEVAHPRLTELHVVDTMHQRKQMMAERADVFVALPGGIGTFEELFEVWTWRQLGYHDKPLGLLNAGGYYDGLLAFMQHTQQQGFVQAAQSELLEVHQRPAPLLDRLHRLASAATRPDDYRRI